MQSVGFEVAQATRGSDPRLWAVFSSRILIALQGRVPVSGLSKVGNGDVALANITETDPVACVSFELAIPYASPRPRRASGQIGQGQSASRVAKCSETKAGVRILPCLLKFLPTRLRSDSLNDSSNEIRRVPACHNIHYRLAGRDSQTPVVTDFQVLCFIGHPKGYSTTATDSNTKPPECHLMAWATPSAVRWRDAAMLEGRPDRALFCRMTMV